ncbi:unnamed protein product [Clonostachys rhizophaga]|uniref:Uncharacterized protein n=1 Tax=Clonostachys rhizophaga TaxID=160324 RepID=A0A9N9VWH9_9HYPO|nr:unnamed protein product [Clonostachys rhizophaga]
MLEAPFLQLCQLWVQIIWDRNEKAYGLWFCAQARGEAVPKYTDNDDSDVVNDADNDEWKNGGVDRGKDVGSDDGSFMPLVSVDGSTSNGSDFTGNGVMDAIFAAEMSIMMINLLVPFLLADGSARLPTMWQPYGK